MMVQLVCIREKSKLRVRITSPGYLKDANCQFPRDLRVEGRRQEVASQQVTLVESRGKHFQSVPKNVVFVIEDIQRVQEDTSTEECAICLEKPKEMVFAPCGHYQCCRSCTARLDTCPICRQRISNTVAKSELL